MHAFWKRLIGLTIADRYDLKQALGGDEGTAFFLARAKGEPEPVVFQVENEDPEQLARWARVQRFSHPNLIALRDCGRAEADGDSFIYAAFESAEETAAAALERSAMAGGEVREVLPAVAGALQYLHEKGFVHTAVSPEHIWAVGDQVKLSSYPVREASGKHSPQNDVWDLGAAVYELLTRRRLNRGDELDLTRIEEPFRSIVQQALTGAANLESMVSALDAPAAIEPVHAPEPEPAVPLAAMPVPSPDPPPAMPAAPPVSAAPIPAARTVSPRPMRETHPVPPAHNPMPRWAYPAAGAAIVAVVLLVTGRPDRQPQAAAPIAPVSAPVLPPATRPLPKAAPPPASAPAVKGRPYWRVVAYTYSRLKPAQEKVEHINRRYPALRAAVFAPHGTDRAPYFVALGGRMSKSEAMELQKRARASGMPRDTFVRNYAE